MESNTSRRNCEIKRVAIRRCYTCRLYLCVCAVFQTSSEFSSELAKRGVTVSQYSAQTYDAVWAMAFAILKTESIFNGKNNSVAHYGRPKKELASNILQELRSLQFEGVSVSLLVPSIEIHFCGRELYGSIQRGRLAQWDNLILTECILSKHSVLEWSSI